MLHGCGASVVASLGPSSFAALARALVSTSMSIPSDILVGTACPTLGQRAASTNARLESVESGTSSASASLQASASDDSLQLRPLEFSIRPSALSPLFPSWDRARRISARREHLSAVLESHRLLSSRFEANGDTALAKRVRRRIDGIKQTASQLRQLLDEPVPVTACPSPSYAAAFCATLEASASHMDPTAREFARVQRGEASPWSHYARFFHEAYRDAPRLQPLEVIFSKPDPVELARQIGAAAAAAAAAAAGSGGGAAAGSGATGLPRGVIGPHVDVAGVTHAAGKRKASSATLDLVPGSGQITINGLPVAAYFRDVDIRRHALEPLMLTGQETKYDISVRVRGGGSSGQAQAVRTAVARALCVQQPALGGQLAEMTRWDGRVVERKKPGRKKARKGFTWVKR